MTSVKVGDKVTFYGGRRGKQEGVVAEIKYPQRRMTKRVKLAMAYADALGVDLPASALDKSPVAMVDVKGLVWKVSTPLLKVVGAGDAQQALHNVYEQKNKIAEAKAEARDKAWDIIDAKGLDKLQPKDVVKVEYKNCTRVEVFAKFSPSGQVGIISHGKTRFIHPKFVSLTNVE